MFTSTVPSWFISPATVPLTAATIPVLSEAETVTVPLFVAVTLVLGLPTERIPIPPVPPVMLTFPSAFKVATLDPAPAPLLST